MRKILVMGLPGAGKTTLAKLLAPRIKAVLFDGDSVRQMLWPDLGMDHKARVEHARRMGVLCDLVNKSGQDAIAAFICPTHETRNAFGSAIRIWVDRIKEGRYADTNQMFQPPVYYDLRLDYGSPYQWLDKVLRRVQWLHKMS